VYNFAHYMNTEQPKKQKEQKESKMPWKSSVPMGGNPLWRNLLSVILIFFILSSLYTAISESRSKTTIIPLSELATDVTSAKVQKITVDGDALNLEYADGVMKTSKKEDGEALSQTLVNYGVTTDNIKKVEISVKSQSGAAFWFLSLAPIFLPIFFILFFIWYLSRHL